MEADINAINEVLNQFASYLRNGDFNRWISLWTDDGIQMPPDAPTNTGKEQINDVMKPVFDQMNLNMTIHTIDETKVSGDLGLTRCTYTLELIPKEGGETVNAMPDGKALTLYERQSDGTWKIKYDCFNSNIPAG
jgi:uncharacterized protein (TIGR02246 family)